MRASLALVLVLSGHAAAEQPEGKALESGVLLAYLRPAPDFFRGPAALDRMFDAARPAPPLEATPWRQTIRSPRPVTEQRAPLISPMAPARPPAPRTGLLVPIPVETSAYRRTFKRLLSDPGKTDAYDSLILKYAQRYGLNPRLLKGIIAAESEFVRKALSPRGARGLMQLMGATAKEMGVASEDLSDPEQNIRAGAAYLQHLFKRAWKRFGLEPRLPFSQAPIWLTQKVVASYNAGPRFLSRTKLFRETREYIRKVLLFMKSPVTLFRREPLAAGPALPPMQAGGHLLAP